MIPSRAEELLQVIVRPWQTRNATRHEEIRSVAPGDLQEAQERCGERAIAARFLVHPVRHPVELTFNRLRGVVTEIRQYLRGLQREAARSLDLRPDRLVLLQCPAQMAVQLDEITVYLLEPPSCVSRTCSSEASISVMRALSFRPLATSGGRPSSINAPRTAWLYAVNTLACQSWRASRPRSIFRIPRKFFLS